MCIKAISAPFIFAFVLSGCTTNWHKPGGTEAEFYNDRSACMGIANNMWPVNMTQMGTGYTTPVTTNCYRVGNSMNCQQTGGQYIPPATIDTNASVRAAEVRSCLRARGYIQQ